MDKSNNKIRITTILTIASALLTLLVSVLIIYSVNKSMKQEALHNAEDKAMIILERNLATHDYFTDELKPKVFELSNPYRPVDYFEPAWMSSTYAVDKIDKIYKQISTASEEYYYRTAAINPRNPDHEADEFEAEFLKQAVQDPGLVKRSGIRIINDEPFFYLIRRGSDLRESCMKCHSEPDKAPAGLIEIYGSERGFHKKVGEPANAISIKIPLTQAFYYADIISYRLTLLLSFIMGLFFILHHIVYNKYLLKPLKLLHDRALHISENDDYLGEQLPIPTGKEFGELTASFNKMSSHLRIMIDELEDKVMERTKELNAALDDKDILIKEIHHRVKNNLTVIQSLLSLQAMDISDAGSRDKFIESESRVRSMSIIHEHLSLSESHTEINIKDYFETLASQVAGSYSTSDVKLDIAVADELLDVELVIPCGLIINELLSNAFKHAFKDKDNNIIAVSFAKDQDGSFTMSVKDNGVGLSENIDISTTSSLGMRIVHSLVRQLKGNIKVIRQQGTEFKISFASRK